MPEANLIRPNVARQCVSIDGTYVNVSDRLRPLVSLLAAGCSEIELRREVDAIRPGHSYDALQLRDLIDQLFGAHCLAIDETSRNLSAIWRLRQTSLQQGATGSESALRCRITVVPEALANRVAHSLTFLYGPRGVVLALALWSLISVGFLSRCGLHSLSLSVLFKSIHQASALSVAVTLAAITFASLVHELGHCTAVAAFGSRVRRIGFGIYWLSPALFSDVSSTWTLTRWQRVAVDCGGMYFQALVCALYALGVMLTRSVGLQLGLRIAIVANIVAVLSSLNPIMKCDGYWIISDALGIPNLRRQSERAMRDLFRGLVNHRQPLGEVRRRAFLLGYGFLSLLFSAAMLVLFAIVLRRNASEAIYFPSEVWNFFGSKMGTGFARLAMDFLKVVPVACAPIALLTATSGLMGFLRRTFSGTD